MVTTLPEKSFILSFYIIIIIIMHFSTLYCVASASVCFTETNCFLLVFFFFLSFVGQSNYFKVTKNCGNISISYVCYLPRRVDQIFPLETAEVDLHVDLLKQSLMLQLLGLQMWPTFFTGNHLFTLSTEILVPVIKCEN